MASFSFKDFQTKNTYFISLGLPTHCNTFKVPKSKSSLFRLILQACITIIPALKKQTLRLHAAASQMTHTAKRYCKNARWTAILYK